MWLKRGIPTGRCIRLGSKIQGRKTTSFDARHQLSKLQDPVVSRSPPDLPHNATSFELLRYVSPLLVANA